MKKILRATLFAVALFAAVNVSAGSKGIKAGLNFSNMGGTLSEHSDVRVGFNVGFVCEQQLINKLYLQSGLDLTTKGQIFKSDLGKSKSRPLYLQLPVHLAYKIDVMNGQRFYVHGGPFLACGLSGRTHFKDDSSKIFGDEITELKRFDWGLGLGVGYEIGSLFFDLGWDFGLFDLSRVSGVKSTTQNAYLNVGIKF